MSPLSPTIHTSRRGLRLPLAGAPEQRIDDATAVTRVAVLAADAVGMRARFAVAEGDAVRRGDALFEDRKNPGVHYTAPGAGTVLAIHRGDRRALQAVVIQLHPDEFDPAGSPPERPWATHPGSDPSAWDAENIQALLLESGLWTCLRARPGDGTPKCDATPCAIFVTATDSQPLAPDLDVALADRDEDLQLGLQALVVLARGQPVHLCRSQGSQLGRVTPAEVRVHEFSGPHPAGTVGLHIHRIDPVDAERQVWHLGVQDLVAFGSFLRTGRLDLQRVVALTGPGARQPRLLRTRVGACVDELVAGELAAGTQRVISGSALHGRTAMGDPNGYLGRFHQQLTVLPEDPQRRFLGWLRPGLRAYSNHRLFLSWLTGRERTQFSTTTNGSQRSMVPIGAYERVFPFDLLPTFLMRSVLAGDSERAQELGVLELVEEDVALLSFVCPSKIDFGPALRAMLTHIEREG